MSSDEINILSNLRLISDQAVLDADHGSVKPKDGLGFTPYANVLASTCSQTPGPFTIGIFGEWGTGKTSLMRLTQKILSDNKSQILTVWFNAWRYEKEEHPIVPLVATIIQELESKKAFMSKAKAKKASLIRSLRAVAYGFSAKSKVGVPGFGEVEAGFVAKDMIDRNKQLTPDPLLQRSLYYDAFNALSEAAKEMKHRIVIFIDDLDRCLPPQAIHMLESIKLVLAQPGFLFVLGISRRVIEGYLQHRYSTEFGIREYEGEKYLDKMVQLPFYIPPHNNRMQTFAAKMLDQLEPEDQASLKDIVPIIGEACNHNPRATIRFINNLLIDRAISNQINKTIDIGMFAVTRSLQMHWPEVYRELIHENSRYICREIAKINKSNKSELHSWALDSHREYHELIAKINSSPSLTSLLISDHGKIWLNEESQRNSTIEFLQESRFQEDRDLSSKLGPRVEMINHDFSFLNLENQDIQEAILQSSSFENANLKRVDLRYADLSSSSLHSANLEGANLEGANLTGCHFVNANLEGANLRKTLLNEANFTNCNLRNAILNDAIIYDTIFDKANFSRTDISGLIVPSKDWLADLQNSDSPPVNLDFSKYKIVTMIAGKRDAIFVVKNKQPRDKVIYLE